MDLITTPAAQYTVPSGAVVYPASAWLGASRGIAEPVQLVQYDDTLPILAVALYLNGQPYTLPEGAAVNIRMDKHDGHYVYNPALGVSEDRQTAYIGVTLQMTTGAGCFAPALEIVVDGEVAGTSNIPVVIAANQVPEDAVASTDEFKTVQALAQQAQAAADAAAASQTAAAGSASAAAESESAAKTSETNAEASATNAANSASAAATSEGNAANSATSASGYASNAAQSASAAAASAKEAEQWAEQAQQIAQGAMGWYTDPQALQSAHPTGQNGQWAIVGTTDTIWIWDSDTSAWVDSGSNMDLSQYYTKTEADARFGTVQQVQQAQSAATAAQSTADNAQSAAEQAQATANAAAVIEKIWQNPYPTVEYAAQTISVPGLADYDMIIIFTNANGTLPYAYNPPTMAPKMGNNEIHVTSYQGTFTRGFAVNFLLNSIAIGDAYTAGIDNRYLVPALIFGIKF